MQVVVIFKSGTEKNPFEIRLRMLINERPPKSSDYSVVGLVVMRV